MKDAKAMRRILAFSVLLIMICVGVSYMTVFLMTHREEWAHDQPGGHQWLHEKLGLTPAEAGAIDQYEHAYRTERSKMETDFRSKIALLAATIGENEAYTPEVTAIVHDIHGVHGKLQLLSIEHYYEMLHALPPSKRDKLKELAITALSQPE